MSSVGALLVGTPAKINPDLLSGSGVLVDSVNGLHGDVLLAAGSGMSAATNAGTNTVTYTNAGVTSAVAGTGISVSGATGAVTFSAPTLLPKQTAYVVAPNVIIPAQTFAGASGYVNTDFGAAFTVPATGIYLLECSLGFDTNGGAGVAWSAKDWMSVGIRVPAGGVGAGVDLQPWTVDPGADNDYGITATTTAVLTVGVNYQAYWSRNIDSVAGSTIPSTTASVEVISLCA